MPTKPVRIVVPFAAGGTTVDADKARALGITSVQDFIRYAKANPGRLNMASSGNGTSIHPRP